MSTDYSSFKFKTTHFHLANIQNYLLTQLPYNIESYELNSTLSSVKLNSILSILFSKTFFFDKMESKSKSIEKIKYLYMASMDSNMNFIASCDSESNIDGIELSNKFLEHFDDSNLNYLIHPSTNIKYNCFRHESFYFIGLLVEFGSYNLILIIETYQDDSTVFDLNDIHVSELDYGFPILSENQVFLNHLQDPNTSMFEYAS